MIRYLKDTEYDGDKDYVEIACLSTDTKPSEGIITGSMALEVNTGKIYAYDEVSGNWTEI